MNFSVEKKIVISNVKKLQDLITFLHSLNEQFDINSLLDFEIEFKTSFEKESDHHELNELLKLYNPKNTSNFNELDEVPTEDEIALNFEMD